MRTKKKQKKKTALRNLLLVAAAAVLAVVSTELILGIGNADGTGTFTEEERARQEAENGVLLTMDREKMLFEYPGYAPLFTDPETGGTADPETLADPEGEAPPEYPILSYLQRGVPYGSGTKTIVVLGDSFVWGESSINRNEIFWRLLETSLRAQGYDVRVCGVGYTGANSVDELKWLTGTSLVDDLDPDLVLFGYFYNDPDVGLEGTGAVTNATLNASFVPDGKNDGIIRAVSNLLPNIGERLANYVTARSMYSTESSFVPIFGVPPVLKGQVLENYRRDFIEPLDEYAAGADFPVAIVTLPLYRGRIVQQALFRPLRELCAGAEHIRLYDSLHDLYARFAAPKHADNYVINIADGHPGSAIQYFYAQYIERFLKKDYADVLGAPCGEDLNAPLPTVNEALPGRTAPKLTERTDDESVWRFYYPSETRDYSFADFSFPRYHLTLPLEKSFVALSFAEPVDLARIELSGEGLEDAEIYYRCVNETLGYDDHTVRPFGTKDGGVRTDDAPDRVTTLMIHAKCRNDDGAVLTMKLTTAGHGG